ncbi:MAG: septum formation protein Maf [Candidatus Lindowbacteria bacterium]|nr:septum formation protein Maf [Candidatus Lindowbacteria bacterium]
MPPLILASGSPRRRELLEEAGFEFVVKATSVDETLTAQELEKPDEAAQKLAKRKAQGVANENRTCVVLGSDTIVAIQRETGFQILGKPENRADSKRMIQLLSGKSHSVYTSVALFINGEEFCEVDKTTVIFRELTSSEIDAYVATGEGDDKAGAYAIQGLGVDLVDHFEGDIQTVVGLPISLVKKGLNSLGYRC